MKKIISLTLALVLSLTFAGCQAGGDDDVYTIGICSGCSVATLSISYYDLGYATGQMAAQILKGEADISEMRIQYAPEPTAKYNPDLCDFYGLTPPEGYVPIGE